MSGSDETPCEEDVQFEQPDTSGMSAADWREYLTEHPDRRLLVENPDRTHTFKYDHDSEKVLLYRFSGGGYYGGHKGGGVALSDDDTQDLLEAIAHADDETGQIHVELRDDIAETEVRVDVE